MSYLARPTLVQAATSATDFSGLEGYFVKVGTDSAGTANKGVTPVTAATNYPLGVIVDGQTVGGNNAVALPGTIVRVKANVGSSTTIIFGSKLALAADGSVILDDGTVGNVIVAVALEASTATILGELIIARLVEPVLALTFIGTSTSANEASPALGVSA